MSKSSSRPIRFIVRHHHTDINDPLSHAQEVYATYHSDIEQAGFDALDLAIHTAQRYQGVIYAEYAPDDIEFVRSYAKRGWWHDEPEAA